MEKEIWRDVEGYEGYYQVSSTGRVKGVKRKVWNGQGFVALEERQLNPCVNEWGYLFVNLTKNNKGRIFLVHRLVLSAFIPNVHNKRTVNHKNCIKTDNNLSNLEWNTDSENLKHAYKHKLLVGYMKDKFGAKHPNSKPISQYSLDGILIKEYGGQREAARESGLEQASIGRVCQGKQKTSGRFIWKFKNRNYDNNKETTTKEETR